MGHLPSRGQGPDVPQRWKPLRVLAGLPVLVLVLVDGGGRRAVAQSVSCSTGQWEVADAAADRVKTWMALRRWQHRFGGCDDGGTAEALSDTVAAFLTQRWDELMRLGGQVEDDPGFRTFVLRHIDAVGFDDPTWKQARRLAVGKCTPGNLRLCGQIRDALDQVGR